MGTPNLPVAAPDPADEIRERVDAAETDGWYGYDAEARADVRWLLVERQQDKERIEALTTATEGLLDVGERSRRGDPSLDPEEWYAIRDCARKLLEPAALAVEEDAPE